MKVKYLYLLMVVATLCSCAHALPYQSSGINAPSSWGKLKDLTISDENTLGEQQWWKYFKDATLDELIQQAIIDNKTLGIARARVQEALANVAYGNASQLPEIDFVGQPQRGDIAITSRKPVGIIEGQLQATWEIDVFGRNLPRLAQAAEIVQYADASRQAVLVGLLSQLADGYFDLQDDKMQIALTEQNLKIQQKTLELIKAQQKGAMASDFDVERAQAQVSTTEAKLPALRSAYQTALNGISVLLGANPNRDYDDLVQHSLGLQPLDQNIIVAAPATVMANRPDIKAAERNFAASISNKQYAAKKYFPDISLLSYFGAEGISKATPIYPWLASLNIIEPVIDFGRIRSQINVAKAQETQAFLSYQETILEALQDMKNALITYKNEMVRNQLLRDSVNQNRRSETLAQQQFKSGFIGLLDLLVIQANLLDAESALADSDVALRKDLVHIYVASGGGWNIAS